MFGSMVGSSVGVPASGVAVRAAGSIVPPGDDIGVGGIVPVGVQGIGWKGVNVGVAFGAAVTNTNGKDD